MKFKEFLELKESGVQYNLNENGKNLMDQFNKFIEMLRQFINEENVVALISRLDTDNIGNEKYKIAKKIATLSKNGTAPIDGSLFSISDNDQMMNYLDRVNT
jgi:predicted transcriptional regulator